MPNEIRTIERTVPFATNGSTSENNGGLDYMVLRWIGSAGLLAPPYWSQARDKWLREFYLRSDYLKIATSTFVSKAVTVPLTILPQDNSVKAHVAQAMQLQQAIQRNSGIMNGFQAEFAKFATDWLTQDNGAFMLIMGAGKADGPIRGPVSGVMHLDSSRCNRSDNPEFPVTYEHTDGKRYALYYTRVLFMAAMPSAVVDHRGVGLSSVSRCVDVAQELMDIAQYAQEKLGSRPARQILYAKKGATLDQLSSASAATNAKLDSQGLDRFSKTMLLAPKIATQELDLGLIDLASTPDGFDREKVTMLDVAVIASAYGLDMRDLAHSFGVSGQTKADAEVQNLKTQGKGVGEFLRTFTQQFNAKALPDHLYAQFDYVDDTQDEASANIRKTRAESRERDIASGVTTVRVEREQMLADGEITEAQFVDMELEDGRLPDGLDVLMLFQSQDGEIATLLNLGVDDPLDVEANDTDAMLTAIHEQTKAAWVRHDTAPNANIRRKARQSLAALDKLKGLYMIEPINEAAANADVTETIIVEDETETDEEPSPVELKAIVNQYRADYEVMEKLLDLAAENVDVTPEVKELITKQDAELTAIENEYTVEFEELITQAVEGDITESELVDALSVLVATMLAAAMLRGSGLDELTIEMSQALQIIIDQNLASVENFAADIAEGRYGPEELGLSGALTRIDLWAGVLGSVYAMGQTHQADDPFLRWVWSPLKDHCRDCRRLNGQVHRASEWQAAGWVPRGQMLACRGYRCGCSFISANGPASGGF